MSVDEYCVYLESTDWEAKRLACIERAGRTCQKCGGRATTAHHLTYERLGDELPEDLEAVCRRCHERIHFGGYVLPLDYTFRPIWPIDDPVFGSQAC